MVTEGSLDTWFSGRGRIGRAKFFWRLLALNIAVVPFWLFSRFLGEELGKDGLWAVAIVVLLIIAVPFVWFLICQTIKRVHDVGLPGWVSVAILIPYINVLFALALLLIPGRETANKDEEVTQPTGSRLSKIS